MSTSEELEQKVNACTTIGELFELWKQAQNDDPNYPNNSHQKVDREVFHADGIVDTCEDYYNSASPKVLFLLKEPNVFVGDYKPDENSSAVSWVRERYVPDKEGKIKKHRMCTIISKIYSNIFMEKEMEVGDSLKQIAYMNLNKRGGASVAKKYLFNYIKDYKVFIKKEILLLNPDYVIVGGEGLLAKIVNILYPNKELKSDHSFVDVENNIKYFDTYHFSRGMYGLTKERYTEVKG